VRIEESFMLRPFEAVRNPQMLAVVRGTTGGFPREVIDCSWSGTDKPPLPGNCETLIQAAVPAHVIDRGIRTTGLLASVPVAKYAEHLPL
jgi:hypothetical protein